MPDTEGLQPRLSKQSIDASVADRPRVVLASFEDLGRRSRLNAQITEKLSGVREALDEQAIDGKLRGFRMSDVLGDTAAAQLYSGVLRHRSTDNSGDPAAFDGSSRVTSARLSGIDEEMRASEAEITSIGEISEAASTPRGEPVALADQAQAREELLHRVQQQLSSWIDGIDAFTGQAQGSTGNKLDMQAVIQRYFRPWPDRLKTTNEVKMGAGTADVFAGVSSLAEHMEWSETAFTALVGGGLLGSTLLVAAGIEGLKEGMVDTRRLKQLVKPLKAYREALAELRDELKKSSREPTAATELIEQNLMGVQARLRAAKHHLSDSLIEMGISSMHATVGGIGIAEGATALAGASTAAKGLGAAYGAAVAGFGAITATQSGLRLHELDKLAAAVKAKVDQDDPLREPLLALLGHERSTRKAEIAKRSVMAAAGATSLGLEVAGLAGAVPTLGTSLGLTAAGVVMGVATAASFQPIKSRDRALKAVGGVEQTTNLPATFLYEPGHLSRLLDKVSHQSDAIADFKREIIEDAARKKDGSNSFKHIHRAHRVLAKVIPSADKRVLANKMISKPQAVADTSMKFMLRTTELELQYLAQHKVPILQSEIEVLLAEFEKSSSEAHGGNPRKRDLLAQQLMVKAQACQTDAARLARLQDLELRLSNFTKHMGTEFLGNQEAKQAWEKLEVDFIVAHDMVAEALSRNKLKRLQKNLATQADGDAKANIVSDALRKNINVRFARVVTHSYAEKTDYERRGAIEVARAMFVEGQKKQGADATRHSHPRQR